MKKESAHFTHEETEVGHLYYFAPEGRRVTAIVDVASDGTLAGVELVDGMPPPPPGD